MLSPATAIKQILAIKNPLPRYLVALEMKSRRAPGEWQNSRGDATYRPVERGKSEQPQINGKNRADHQTDRDDVHRFNQRKQQIVLANIVRQRAVLEI
jgi:hypothetical protein